MTRYSALVLELNVTAAGVGLVPDIRPADVREPVVDGRGRRSTSANLAIGGLASARLSTLPRFWKLMSIVAPASCASWHDLHERGVVRLTQSGNIPFALASQLSL